MAAWRLTLNRFSLSTTIDIGSQAGVGIRRKGRVVRLFLRRRGIDAGCAADVHSIGSAPGAPRFERSSAMSRAPHTSQRIVIVGGGISGLASAVRLAQSGLPVTLLEASGLGHAASTRNQGWLYSGAWFAFRQPELARMCYESLQKTLHFCPDCLEPAHDGMAFLISKPDTPASDWLRAWEKANIPYSELPLTTLFDTVPGLAQSHVQKAYQLPDRAIRTNILLEQLAAAAENAGAEIRTDTPVTRLLIDGGRAGGVVTGSGEEILAGLIILAGNALGADLWPESEDASAVGSQSEFTRVALKSHLIALRPGVASWPLCVVDREGFNHVPHAETSLFGAQRWIAAAGPTFQQVVALEIEALWEYIGLFFPKLSRDDHEVVEWAATTVQAMHVEQVEPGLAPLPTVIDHEQETPAVSNLLSVFPGRATLWAQLAEQTREAVLSKIETEPPATAKPPWAPDA